MKLERDSIFSIRL